MAVIEQYILLAGLLFAKCKNTVLNKQLEKCPDLLVTFNRLSFLTKYPQETCSVRFVLFFCLNMSDEKVELVGPELSRVIFSAAASVI